MPLAKDVDLSQLSKIARNYSGADIEALCREAALNALRQDEKAEEVTLKDFKESLEKVGPSVSPNMEEWYRNFLKQARKNKKPTTPIT
jgi:transitional endoplasmic reticulum ATPase